MNRFRSGILLRVLLIGLTTITFTYLTFHLKRYVGASLFAFLLIVEIYNLFLYVEGTNRKLTRFLQSIRFSDFDSGFVTDNKLGKSFKALNNSFNEVLDAFRDTRAVSEENLQYLNTVVRHIGIGILSFEQNGKVELLNTAACRLMGINRLNHIHELEKVNPRLLAIVRQISPGSNALFKDNEEKQLSIHATELRLRGKSYKLLSIQNIREELQTKELEAWQNLAVALRHEIVNSITPIASIVDTLNEIMNEEFPEDKDNHLISNDVADDIRLALRTIGKRSKGLVRFVNAYKDFTRIPEPVFSEVSLNDFFREIAQLMMPDMKKANINFQWEVVPDNLSLNADPELLQMALINLLKNAREAVSGKEHARVKLKAFQDFSGIKLSVEDNGSGIIPQALKKIFVPFYSTKSKKGGTGIGLSMSRQIIQQHKGILTVQSVPNERTVFLMRF